MRVSVLLTKAAGEGVSHERLREAVERGGHKLVEIIETDQDLGRVGDESVDLLVAAGGDGTVWRAANAVAGSGIPLAILPLGTANNIAMSLGIAGSMPELIAGWHDARRLPFDLGSVRGSWGESRFMEAVGAGLIPAGIASMAPESDGPRENVDATLVRAAGRYRDILSRLKPRSWKLILDGEQAGDEYLLVEVLNIRAIGPNLVLSAEADPSDGFFSVVTAGEDHREELAAYLNDLAMGRPGRLSLPARRARRIEIHGCDEIHLDDEVHRGPATGTVSVRIEPAAFRVLV